MSASLTVASAQKGFARTSLPGSTAREFLLALFRHLDDCGARYCVLHSWAKLPDELPSDLDIGVHTQDRARLARVIGFLNQDGFKPIQLINHNVNGFYFVFCWDSPDGLQTAAIDVIFEHRRGGLIAQDGEHLTANRERYREFWVACPSVEFAYLLLKKAVKGTLKPDQAARLNVLAGFLGKARAESIAGDLFTKDWSEKVVAACFEDSLAALLPKLKRQIWKTAVTRRPVALLKYLAGDARRWFHRWMNPNGLLVAVLGPDGAGKSSAIGALHGHIGSAFWSERYFHLRPQVLAPRKTAPPVTDPHAKPSRGPLASSAYLTGILADYVLGYVFWLRHLKPRSCLLVFDRYFQDVLVDPKRFRYGGPMWLAKLYARLVPAPDLLVVMDVDTETILVRKAEVPAEELSRQTAAYRQLPVSSRRLRIISANGTRQEVAHVLADTIAQSMSQRFAKMHGEWIGAER